MKLYEVNIVLNTNGEIDTSNTFTEFDEAQRFYEELGGSVMKEFLIYDDGYMIEEVACNYGHLTRR